MLLRGEASFPFHPPFFIILSPLTCSPSQATGSSLPIYVQKETSVSLIQYSSPTYTFSASRNYLVIYKDTLFKKVKVESINLSMYIVLC